jgi:hypothetical protein
MQRATLRKAPTEEERRRFASYLGSIKSERKAAAARENGFKPGNTMGHGRAPLPLSEIACACGAGDALTGHHWKCPRGQAIKRRAAKQLDVLTGKPLEA